MPADLGLTASSSLVPVSLSSQSLSGPQIEGGPARAVNVCCLLLQDLYYDMLKHLCAGGEEEGGRVLWGATSRGLCGRVGLPRTNVTVIGATVSAVETLDLRRVRSSGLP